MKYICRNLEIIPGFQLSLNLKQEDIKRISTVDILSALTLALLTDFWGRLFKGGLTKTMVLHKRRALGLDSSYKRDDFIK